MVEEKTEEKKSANESEGEVSKEDTPEEEPPKEEKETKKYIHNCTKCGKCCEKWGEIPIYLEDLQRWFLDGTINYVLPFIQLREAPPAYVRLVIQKLSTEGEDPNPSGCPLYDYENKICNVYSTMPLHCAAYPLAYNGEKFYLVDTESPGIGHGNMTSESLEVARQRAKDHFIALSTTSSLLPVLYAIIVGNIMRQSQETMESLSEEDKKKLEEMFAKTRETDSVESEDIQDEEQEEKDE
ncbi:MAG: YkgJ family cysteine cluster protein [Candidatus Thorarchaeota archaeon]